MEGGPRAAWGELLHCTQALRYRAWGMPWPKLGRCLFAFCGPDDAQWPHTSCLPLRGVTSKAGSVWAEEKTAPSLPSRPSHPACPARSRMVWEFPDLRILFGEPHRACPDGIITSSLPSGGGKHLLFAFSLIQPTPSL